MACATTLLNRATMAGGVAAGANSPFQEPISNPGNPASAVVGTSGSAIARRGLATASAFSRPLLT